jgi:hypothetical protein
MAFPNISDIVATTIESRNREVADNISNTNAILSAIKKTGGVKTVTGGSIILEELNFAENPNVGWYSGYDTLPLAAADVVSAAQFTIKQASAQVIISGLEQLQNSGKEQMIDLLDARITAAESTLQNLIVKGIYSDGTGAAGKQLTGLKAAISLTPATGTYGGIDRATWAFWRNQKMKGAGTDFAGTSDKTTIFANMLTMFNKLVRGGDKPNLIVMDENYYSIYMLSLTADQRFSDVDTANRGFANVTFMGVPVVMEPQASGMPASTAYFLNTKYLKFRPHKDRNFSSLELGRSTNQDATTHAMVWAGNLTCSAAKFQGVIAD